MINHRSSCWACRMAILGCFWLSEEKHFTCRKLVFTMPWCCARVGISCHHVSACLCVCHMPVLYQNGYVSSWLFAHGLPSTYDTLCFKESGVSPKIRVLPSGNLDLENLATACWLSASVIWTVTAVGLVLTSPGGDGRRGLCGLHTYTHTHNRFTAGLEYVRVHPGKQVPER